MGFDAETGQLDVVPDVPAYGTKLRWTAPKLIARANQQVKGADRARANEWEIKSFGQPWNLPLSAIGRTFFNKAMWQADMMQIAAQDVHPPQHAGLKQEADAQKGSTSEWPADPSDDDIDDCRHCGRRF